jgi:glycosyltransferase involved in cell wall biosynthesis
MNRVVYWSNIPAPYMVDRFNALARRGNVELEAWFSARTHADRSWEVDESTWEFSSRYLPNLARRPGALALPTPLARGPRPDLFLGLYSEPAFLPAFAFARGRRIRTAIWVEFTHDAWITRRPWKEAAKRRLFPQVDGILTGGEDGRSFARRYGGRDERIHCVPHVIDAARFAAGAPGVAERDALRLQLGIRGVTFGYVGRLYAEKGLFFLVEAVAELQRSRSDPLTLLFVGDGPDEAALRARCAAQGVEAVFCGFQHVDALARYYSLADVFVFPTLGEPFGMVVLEAMACGLPVIATSTTGEIGTRVEDGVNGFVVPPADTVALRERMADLADAPDLRRRMGDASRARVAGQTCDVWAEAFESAVGKIVAAPRPGARRPATPARRREHVNLLIVIHYPVFGGPHNQALRLAHAFERQGVATTVLLPDRGDAAARLRAGGVEVITMPLHRARATMRPRPLLSLLRHLPQEVQAIRRIIREREIDVVQLQGLVNPHAAFAARLEGKAVVWQLLDTRVPMPIRRGLMALVVRLSDVVMSTGAAVARLHPGAESLGSRLYSFFPPVDTAAFDPHHVDAVDARASFGLDAADLVLLSIGNLNPQKGHEYFLEAVSLLHKDGGSPPRALIVGASHDTHAEYERHLHRLCDRLELEVGKDVVFTGPLHDVRPALAAADVFVLSSVPLSEGVPTAVEEAMVFGLPVVTTNVGGIAELIEDGTSGILVPPLDATALAGAIRRAADPVVARALGGRARERALRLCSADECARTHLHAYETALRHCDLRNGTHPAAAEAAA